MTPGELAQKYAAACFGIALEEWLGSLRAVNAAIEADQSVVAVLDDQSKPFVDRQRRIEALIPTRTSDAVRRFFGTLISNGDITLLPNVLADLERLAVSGPTAQMATVASAVELDASTRQRVEGSVRERYGQEIQVRFEVDSALIGGLMIRVGDEVIDASVAARLREIDGALRRAT